MDSRAIPNLHDYLEAAASSADPEEQACAQNLLLDERPPAAASDLYQPHFSAGPVADLDDWFGRHRGYATEHLFIDQDEPENPYTFRDINARNRLTQTDPQLNLIRIEHAAWPCSLRGHSFEEVRAQIESFQRGDAAALDFLQGLCNTWNLERDQRPAYVTTEIQVEDCLADGVADWAVQLRNRLGLGHYDPGRSGRPVEIFLMRYPASEVIAALAGQGHPALPTVLDGDLNPFFFPSPLPTLEATVAPLYGRTLNLTAVDAENDYDMGCELLHPRIDYRPEHFYRADLIAEPVTMPLARARGFHLPWVRLYAERDDFGADLFARVGA
ncbi:hypothetical protein [uncultured Thiodictyon sp.]|uniref:hypothetical protein n=1 Tax=uncultured Thiodictyon sp. TaxID=1846217 RepID=UPI0025EFB361|nr:hypothetical protein [uncultured Thiodictyon sp.]